MTTSTGQDATGTLEDRLLAAATGTLELFGIYLGERLGLYEALRADGATTVAGLAERCGIHPRYAREWLEQQSVAGVLVVDDPDLPSDERRYHLPDAHASVVVDPLHTSYVAPLARMVVGIANVIEDVADAYRTGSGVAYARYGADFRNGQGSINRPAFSGALVSEWIPAMSGVADRLEAGGRIADLGCGQGWSTVAVAGAFPRAEVWGIDADQASIDDARRLLASDAAAVRFECADASSLADRGPFDAVMVLEVLHDLADPVAVLGAVRRALAPDGAVLVADEAVAERFSAPGDDLERMMYGWSISHCLPTQMVEQPSAALGTVIREPTVRELAASAGFGRVEVLDVEGGFFRCYELRP